MFLRALVVSAFAVAATGCLEIEQRITLKRNMSGTAKMDFKADMEPAVYMMAYMQKAMMGGGQDPNLTDADLKAARQMFLEQQKQSDKKPSRENIEQELPTGVKLLKFKGKENGTKIAVNALFGFDHIKRLSDVQISGDAMAAAGGGGGKSPMSSILFEEDATSFTIRTAYENPMDASSAPGMEQGPENMPGKIGKVMKAAVDKLGFKMVIDSPFKVLEHNATSKRGNTLTWKFDYASFKKLSQSGRGADIRVKYAK